MIQATEAASREVARVLQVQSKNTGVGCHALLQGIFLTQVSHIAGGFFTI